MGREARIKREAPRGNSVPNRFKYRYIPSKFVGQVNFTDRSYRVLPDGQLRRLSPDTGKEP